MRTCFCVVFSIVIFSLNASAQQKAQIKLLPSSVMQHPAEDVTVSERGTSKTNFSVPKAPLSPLVSVLDAYFTGVSSKFYFQTNSRGLHNVQIDPDLPQNVHAVIMGIEDNEDPGPDYPSRRCFYTFSSDGGQTWKTPAPITSVRTGYPDMILIKRDGKNIPIIAAHRYTTGSTTDFISAIYIEQGDPGTGDFTEVLCSRTASDEKVKNLLWPTIALSKDGNSLYVLADFSDPAPPPPAGKAPKYDYMEFGKFTLSGDKKSAIWNGWSAEPGGADNKGWSSAGGHVIRVADDGRIGVAWLNPDQATPDRAMYFLESTDGGDTWPTEVLPLMPAAYDPDNFRGVAPQYGIDFLYQGTTPHFTWQSTNQILGVFDSATYLFPYSGQLFYWSPNIEDIYCLNYKFPGYTITSAVSLGTQRNVTYLYESEYFTDAVQGTQFPNPSTIGYPTFFKTTDPNVFGIFYTTVGDGDNNDIPDVNTPGWFSRIYYQWTKDGGVTWTPPTPYKENDFNKPIEEWLDYRFPQTSSFNPLVGGNGNWKLMFVVDSLAGQYDTDVGDGGWTFMSWWYGSKAFSGVRKAANEYMSLEQNYPNPVLGGNRTIVPLNLAKNEYVTLTVTDVMGREISKVFSGQLAAGNHELPLSTKSLAAGIYQYIVKAGNATLTRSLTVIK